ncbi:MAG: lysostaphin resistance A-like protein [Anaerolineales bacterium]|jgi:membrane protease YdiL (CAAX protease family)
MNAQPTTFPQQPLLLSCLLHILPGVLVTLGFVLLRPLAQAAGYPPLLAFLLAVLFIDLPVMLGILLVAGKQQTGHWNWMGAVYYREKLPWGKFALIFIGAFLVVYLLITLITPLSDWLANSLFSGLPAWMFLDEQSQYLAYTKNILIFTFTFQLLLTGLVLPWVEEVYFRGYLLPRISRFGWWAPVIGGLFFGLYHLWQPYGFLTVFLLGAALGALVVWTRDLRLSISLHVAANTLARLAFLLAALSM